MATDTGRRVHFVTESMDVMEGRSLRSLTPDSDGYYTQPLMAIGGETYQGIYYDAESVNAIMKNPNSSFNIMLRGGSLFGEYDHPEARTKEDIPRLMLILKKNASHHFKKIWTHDKPLENGATLVLGKVAPFGKYGPDLEAEFKNKNINSCFSVRGLSDESTERGGRVVRRLKLLVTFDSVNTGGFREATKRYCPSMEGLTVTPEDLIAYQQAQGLTTESYEITDKELFNLFGTKTIRIKRKMLDITGLYHPGQKSFLGDDGHKHSLTHQMLLK